MWFNQSNNCSYKTCKDDFKDFKLSCKCCNYTKDVNEGTVCDGRMPRKWIVIWLNISASCFLSIEFIWYLCSCIIILYSKTVWVYYNTDAYYANILELCKNALYLNQLRLILHFLIGICKRKFVLWEALSTWIISLNTNITEGFVLLLVIKGTWIHLSL